MKKKAFGIVLLILAALVLLQGNFGIPFLGGQIFPLIGIGFFAYQSVGALLRRHLTSASFTALVALMIANHFYGILPDKSPKKRQRPQAQPHNSDPYIRPRDGPIQVPPV